eukprot:SAG11_NODE_31714_length_289_cov_2.347368_1_plen_56_part_10
MPSRVSQVHDCGPYSIRVYQWRRIRHAADRGWLRQYFVNYLQLEQVQHLDPDEVEG